MSSEIVNIWLNALLEGTKKMSTQELTQAEIQTEVEEVKASIKNYEVWGDNHAIADCEEYIEVLEGILETAKEKI